MAANGYTNGGAPDGGYGNGTAAGSSPYSAPQTNGAQFTSSGPRSTGGQPTGVNPRTMPLSAAVTPPAQHMDRADGGQGTHSHSSSGEYLMEDPNNPYSTPTPKRANRLKEKARSSIWGRDWETPANITLMAPPGKFACATSVCLTLTASAQLPLLV